VFGVGWGGGGEEQCAALQVTPMPMFIHGLMVCQDCTGLVLLG